MPSFDGGDDDSDDGGVDVTPSRGTERVRRTMRKGPRKSYLEHEGADDEDGIGGGGRAGGRGGRGRGGHGGRKIKNKPHEGGETEGLLTHNYDFAPEAQRGWGLGAEHGPATTEEDQSVYGLGAYGISTSAYLPDPTVKIKPEPETDANGFTDQEGVAQR